MKKLYPLQERYALEVLQSKFFLCMNSSFALAVHTRHLHQLSNIPLIYFYKQHLKRHNTVTVLCLKWNTVISQTKNVEKKTFKKGDGIWRSPFRSCLQTTGYRVISNEAWGVNDFRRHN